MKQYINLLFNYEGENENEGDVGSPYIFLPLYDGDRGSRNEVDRINRTEFINRRPFCASDFSVEGITLLISNSGLVPSDLIMIDYQVVYCTAPQHQATDGFTISHAFDQPRDPLDSYQTIDFVPPNGSISKRIKFVDLSFPIPLANVYFRAKVSTVWHPITPIDEWNFAKDVTVIEAHLRL